MAHIQTQTEWEEDMAGKILKFIRNELYLELRFLDVALSALESKPDDRVATFATDGTYLYYSTEQVIRVFQNNEKFLDRAYLHTVLHCIFAHLWIGGKRRQELWNLSCDIAVEYTIDKMKKKCTRRALTWSRQQIYQTLEQEKNGISAAVIYRLLMEKDKEELLGLQREFYTDDHRFWPKQEDQRAAQQPAAKRWNQIARQSNLQQKQKGEEPKDGEQVLAAQVRAEKSQRSYRDFLHQFAVIKEEMHCDPEEFDMTYYTYGLSHYKNMPLIEPLESREVKKIQEFVIVVDTSYSTSGDLIQGFLRETYGILSQENSFFKDSRIRILQCDDKVEFDTEVTSAEELDRVLQNFTVVGGGGTDFRPAFSYVNELVERGELKNLKGLLYFTDGLGIYPKMRPPYDTAFLYLKDYVDTEVPAWAIRMRLEPETFLES